MYLVSISAKESIIEGKGVFAEQDIKKGEIVWKFVEGHDKTVSLDEYALLGAEAREYLDKVAYLSATSHQYIFPPEDDPALYTNHDAEHHNLSVVVDPHVSDEPFFVANRDIAKGEELTNNYHEFDEAIKMKEAIPSWLQ